MPRATSPLACSIYCLALAFAALADRALATPRLKFDVVTFCCPCQVAKHICQPQFDHLNFPTANGHYIAMGGDSHRMELAVNGNVLAIYYNNLNDGSYPDTSAADKAALIDQYATSGFTNTGLRPNWVILNEISPSRWPSDATYRTWLHDVVHILKNTNGYNVILYSPFPNPANNGADWQAIAADAYIGIENYLDGSQVQAHGFSVNWCQDQYQSSVASYTSLGVPGAKLMLGEHFGQTTAGTSWGRSGISFTNWDTVITVRNQAAQNVGFAGFLSYAWGANNMLVSDAESIAHEDTYRTNQLPVDSSITPPFIILQPQDQSVACGETATFTVYPAGNTPLAYQWRLDGTNLVGATDNPFTISNVQDTNAGNYTVVLANTAGAITSSIATLSLPVALLTSDPFNYPAGENLVGEVNADGLTWTGAGTGANQTTIAGGNLPATGLAASTGNSIIYGVSAGPSARFNFGGTITADSAYYSFLLKVTDLGALNTSGGFFAAFNNNTGTQSGSPTVVGAAVTLRKDATDSTGYNIGIKKAAGGPVWSTTVYHPGETVFLVGRYTFATYAGTTDDSVDLWINPDSASFGAFIPPASTLNNTSGNDIVSGGNPTPIASFVFFRRGDANAGLQPAAMLSDELRIGTSWASVTPAEPAQVFPALGIARFGSNAVLAWPTNAPDFFLETNSPLLNPGSWSPLGMPVHTVGGQFRVTNNIGADSLFYRLQAP